MPTITFQGFKLDARPDRVDYRDLPYRARLQSLPHRYPGEDFVARNFQSYRKLVLDQGNEGACTGFGLAAMLHFLVWQREVEAIEAAGGTADPAGVIEGMERVSTRMLYHLARIYDEWDGQDYEGSSCRGAMKGWHHHGVCSDRLWPYRDEAGKERFIEPREGWDRDAVRRPLGAYYRIDRLSLTDLQSALWEVGAIYVSCYVHDGWRLPKRTSLPTIQPPCDASG